MSITSEFVVSRWQQLHSWRRNGGWRTDRSPLCSVLAQSNVVMLDSQQSVNRSCFGSDVRRWRQKQRHPKVKNNISSKRIREAQNCIDSTSVKFLATNGNGLQWSEWLLASTNFTLAPSKLLPVIGWKREENKLMLFYTLIAFLWLISFLSEKVCFIRKLTGFFFKGRYRENGNEKWKIVTWVVEILSPNGVEHYTIVDSPWIKIILKDFCRMKMKKKNNSN